MKNKWKEEPRRTRGGERFMKDQKEILMRHFFDCVRYWERTLKVSSDESSEPYKRALDELPRNNPFRMTGEPFDAEVLAEFKKSRLMDVYGRDWERHWEEHSQFVRKEDLPCPTNS